MRCCLFPYENPGHHLAQVAALTWPRATWVWKLAIKMSWLPVLLQKACPCRELRGSGGTEVISHALLGEGLCASGGVSLLPQEHLWAAGSLVWSSAASTRVPVWLCTQPRKYFWICPGSVSRPARHPETHSPFASPAFGQYSLGATTRCWGAQLHPQAAELCQGNGWTPSYCPFLSTSRGGGLHTLLL